MNRKSERQKTHKHDKGGWELNEMTKKRVDLSQRLSLGEYQHLGTQQKECRWNSLELRKELRQMNITENQRREYFKKQ